MVTQNNDFPVIPYIEGDGIGVDIWPVAQAVFDAAVEKSYGNTRKVNWLQVLAGEKAFHETGEWLPEETLKALETYPVSIKGPLGTPTGEGHRSLNVTMRQKFDLYACVRPIRYFPGVPSPMKHPERVNLTIFRENVEDIYAGIEWNAGSNEARALIRTLQEEFGVTNIRFPNTSSIGIKPISEEGSKRLIRAAIEYALKNELTKVAIAHKGNIQKFTEGGFRRWGYEVAQDEFADELESGKLVVTDVIADNFFQQVLLNPEQFQVVALTNLNGDYASDAVAAQVGGIGISPGANINYTTGHALFEATHGTAPDIAGKDMANPCSLLLSGAMLFTHLGWAEAAQKIESAIEATIASGVVTGDFARLMSDATKVGTRAFGTKLIEAM